MSKLSDAEIRALYRNPKEGLIGASAFAAKHGIPIKRVREALRGEDVHTLNVELPRVFPRRPYYVSFPNSIWETDLAVYLSPDVVAANRGYQYIFFCIDQFSRYVWARPLKTKQPVNTAKALEEILEEAEHKPTTLRSDRGSEFMGEFDQLLKKNRIKHWFTYSPIKCAQAERFIRTLRQRIGRLRNATNSFNWIDHLDDLIYSYNHTINAAHGFTPADALLPENRDEIYNELYAPLRQSDKKQAAYYGLNVGQFVRIPDTNIDLFTKTDHTRVSVAIYKIKRQMPTNPATYELEDLGEPPQTLKRKYYEEELVEVDEPEIFDVDRILEREFRGKGRKRQEWLYVSYLGYPNNERFNRWIPAKDLEVK